MPPAPDHLVQTLISLAGGANSQAIEDLLAKVELRGGADAVAAAQRDLYWKNKDIAAVIVLSKAGIAYLLKSAEALSDPAEAAHAGHEAKALAYNLGSFTWPGWNEAGVTLSAADVAEGFEAARLNLRLAEELRRPEKAKASAFWLLGAHELAERRYELAAKSFGLAKTHATLAGDPLLRQMLDGYSPLIRLLMHPDNEQARRDFDSTIASLRENGSEEGRDYANQLVTALAALPKWAGA